MENAFAGFECYNVEFLERKMRKKFLTHTLRLALLIISLVIFAVLDVIFGSMLIPFIICTVGATVSLVAAMRCASEYRFGVLKSFSGEIVRVHKDIKNISKHPMATFGLFRRRYDQYWREEVRLTLNVSSGDDLYTVQINGLSNEEADFYSIGDMVYNVFGARFPLKAMKERDLWICPVCGRINAKNTDSCDRCGTEVLNKK